MTSVTARRVRVKILLFTFIGRRAWLEGGLRQNQWPLCLI
jgi:hypothetical protein